jgi:hypothetical protein
VIDEDGDLQTEDDQEFAAGWTFNLETDATILDSEPVTGDGEEGFAWFVLELGDSADATITEDLQDGYELIDAFCVDITQEPEAIQRNASRLAFGDLVGELEGDSVSFTIDPNETIGCVFVNHLVPEDSVGGETETPEITLPPTDAFGGPAAPSNESWRIMLVVMAGILASVLILTPSPATRRK